MVSVTVMLGLVSSSVGTTKNTSSVLSQSNKNVVPPNLSSDCGDGDRRRRTAVKGNLSHKSTTSFRQKSICDPREFTVTYIGCMR